jgi:hypothetical protein
MIRLHTFRAVVAVMYSKVRWYRECRVNNRGYLYTFVVTIIRRHKTSTNHKKSIFVIHDMQGKLGTDLVLELDLTFD